MPPEELETRMQAVSVLRRYSQVIGDLAVGKKAQTALREPLAGAGGPPTTAAPAASDKMTPQQMGLILSGLDAAHKPYLDRKVTCMSRTRKTTACGCIYSMHSGAVHTGRRSKSSCTQ